jgi:hypothetical protein
MKTISLIKVLILTCAVGIFAGSAQADEKTVAAVTVARDWLALVDAQEYKRSWQETAPFFQENVNESQWEKLISSVRGPLGNAESRELIAAQFTTTLPGAPEGEYVVIQFKTNFAGKPDSVETITPMLVEGTWRVSGYFIK